MGSNKWAMQQVCQTMGPNNHDWLDFEGVCILQWAIMEVTMTISLGFDKCYCIQFLTLVEYNKKGLTYVK